MGSKSANIVKCEKSDSGLQLVEEIYSVKNKCMEQHVGDESEAHKSTQVLQFNYKQVHDPIIWTSSTPYSWLRAALPLPPSARR